MWEGKVHVAVAGSNANGQVEAFNAKTRASVPGFPVATNGLPVIGSISAAGDRIFVGSVTGAQLWSASVASSGSTAPVIADGIVFLSSRDGYLHAFSERGEVPSARLNGGSLGIKPALTTLKPMNR